jgi:hypothetical protein
MPRWWIMLALAMVVAGAGAVAAQSRAQVPVKEPTSRPEFPLHLYLAKGGADACGPGCSEWIAAEGRFDAGAAGRAIAFLNAHAARKLPVYFHSPGGSAAEAMALGRELRRHGVTTGVSRTVPHACALVGDQLEACQTAKRSGRPVAADWRPDGVCNSACVFALLGGKVRQVPPSARLGVHSGKLTGVRRYSDGRVQPLTAQQLTAHKGKLEEMDFKLRRYVREMGISGALMDTALKVPNESAHYLSRDEVARFGIDVRDFQESPWFVVQASGNTTHLSKWILETRGPLRNDNRVSVILIQCWNARTATVRFLRGLASNEVGRSATALLSIGKHKARFALKGNGIKLDTIDTGSLFLSASSYVPMDEIEAAASDSVIGLEIDPPHLSPSHLIELSTHGLADGIKRLRETCAPAAKPAPRAGVMPD